MHLHLLFCSDSIILITVINFFIVITTVFIAKNGSFIVVWWRGMLPIEKCNDH
jgi:hypothetical protein